MTINIGALFQIIDEAKNLKAYPIANTAWCVLLDLSLDKSYKEIKFLYEDAGDEGDYYDLATISDGLREACIPIPLLKPNIVKAFKAMSQKIDRRDHDRQYDEISFEIEDGKKIKDYIEEIECCVNQKKAKLKKLSEKLNEIPDIRNLIEKYLNIPDWNIPVYSECTVCHYFANGEGGILCATHPEGYPPEQCLDWKLSSDSSIIKNFEEDLKNHIEYEEKQEKINLDYKKKVEKEKEELRDTFQFLTTGKKEPVVAKGEWVSNDCVYSNGNPIVLIEYTGEIFWFAMSKVWGFPFLNENNVFYPLVQIEDKYFLVKDSLVKFELLSSWSEETILNHFWDAHCIIQEVYNSATTNEGGKKVVYFPSSQQWRRIEE